MFILFKLQYHVLQTSYLIIITLLLISISYIKVVVRLYFGNTIN